MINDVIRVVFLTGAKASSKTDIGTEGNDIAYWRSWREYVDVGKTRFRVREETIKGRAETWVFLNGKPIVALY